MQVFIEYLLNWGNGRKSGNTYVGRGQDLSHPLNRSHSLNIFYIQNTLTSTRSHSLSLSLNEAETHPVSIGKEIKLNHPRFRSQTWFSFHTKQSQPTLYQNFLTQEDAAPSQKFCPTWKVSSGPSERACLSPLTQVNLRASCSLRRRPCCLVILALATRPVAEASGSLHL